MTATAKIAAVVLAGGQSRRTGPVNKLLAPLDGASLIERTVDAVLQSRPCETLVVTGHQSQAVQARLAGRALRFVHNPAFAAGLSTSLRAGIAALGDDIDAALICLGDMPRVRATVIRQLMTAYDPARGAAIVAPRHAGRRGNPVVWDRRYFAEMQALEGDVGARRLLQVHADAVREVEVDDDAVLVDFDTPEQLRELRD